jgi:hypothetical protein
MGRCPTCAEGRGQGLRRVCFLLVSFLIVGLTCPMFYSEGRILQDVLENVERHGNSSTFMALLNAADRDFDITTLEKRLSDSRISILVCRQDSYYEVIDHPENLATTGRGHIAGNKFILHAVTEYQPVCDRARSLPPRHFNPAA